MSKKIVAMLMAVAMAFSLLPVTAFATGGTQEGNSQTPVPVTKSENNLTMNKTVTPEGDGTYTVQLESYATGSVIPTQAPVPMDIVLVLDVSGSMTDEIAYYTYQAINKTSWSVSDVYNAYYQKDILGIPHRTDVTYYAKIDDEYYPVSYKQKRVSQGVFSGYYEYWLEANNKVLGQKVTDSTWKKEVYNEALYTRKTDSNKTVAKLEAMKTAVNNFIDSVAAQKNGNTPVAHRISIVKFAGTSTNKVGNDTYGDGKNYTQKVRELTDVTAEGSVASLKKAVNDLTAGGATAADRGMQKAKDVLIKRESTENPSIVIMFTDGEPNHGNDYQSSVAGDTVQAAKDLKDRGTKVYTIGMFKNLKPSNADKVDTYMNGVSSNYPEAVKAYNDSGVTLGTRAEGSNYYFKADNAGALDQVFQTISQSTTVTSTLDNKAVVVDNVPSNFALTENSVKVYNVDVTFKIVGGTWNGDNPTAEDKTVQVTLTNGKGSLADVTIPTGVADADHQGDGTWSPATPQAGTEITQDGNKVFTLTFQEKEEQKPADPVKLDVSRSKTAKPLDTSTWTSNVTLSLPSAEYEPVIDVVFILDDTYAGNGIFKDAATGLLNELSEKKNLDVNVGIVNFDAVARDWVAATTNSQYSGLVSLKNTEGLTALQNAIATKLDKNNDGQTKKIGATNIEWPLEMAQNMLASGKGTEKYAILFSDMYGYVYRGDLIIDGQTYENVPLSKRLYAGESKFYQGSLSMGTKYQSFADVYAHRNDEENQTTDGFFRDSSWDSYWSIYSGHMQIPTNPATKDSADPFGVPGGYSGFEKSTCLVYDRLLQMKQAGINISIVNNDFAPGDIREVGYVQSIKNDMLDTLEQKGISVIKTQENVTAEDMTNVFDTLKDQLIQVVSAGSTVTDKIGTNFDFVGLNTMSLKIGDNTIPGVIDEATNTITFKHGGKDNAHVVVYDSSADSFTWTINEDVTKDARVQLTYSVKLTKPETAAGTYGVTDLNGDGKVDGTDTTYTDTDALYTNESATMVPKDSNGKTGAELTFPKPSVSYTIKSSSGSHSGGSRPSLNTKDHYGYIIGYPVDYYTGQPTTDQTKKPVRPEGKITRAEVATIYFRMLTDESRTKFWSQSNSYSDVKTGDWFNNAVSTLSNAGIIAGYEDGSFRPNGYITRAEFATIAARFFDVTYNGKDLFPDISGHWAKDYINQAANKGFVNGYEDGTFKPDRNITRAEAVTLVNRTLDRHPDKSHFTKDMLVWPDNMDQTKWYYADMQEATNSHTYQMKENSDKTKYENWTKTLPIRNWEALEKAWSNANSSQGNGNVV